MISVKLKYQLFGFLPIWLCKHVVLPETWDECNGNQVKALLYSKGDAATDDRFIARFTGLRYQLVKQMDRFQQYKLIEQFASVAQSYFSGKFYIKRVKCGKLNLWAPADKMKGVTFGQFIYVDAFFNDKDPESVAKFITHLYLPTGEKFNDETCAARTQKLNIDAETTEAILYNYSLFYEYFARAYPLLFNYSTDQHKHSGTKALSNSETKYDPRGWLKVYESIVGTDIVNGDKYADVPVNTMFRFLSNSFKKQRK